MDGGVERLPIEAELSVDFLERPDLVCVNDAVGARHADEELAEDLSLGRIERLDALGEPGEARRRAELPDQMGVQASALRGIEMQRLLQVRLEPALRFGGDGAIRRGHGGASCSSRVAARKASVGSRTAWPVNRKSATGSPFLRVPPPKRGSGSMPTPRL